MKTGPDAAWSSRVQPSADRPRSRPRLNRAVMVGWSNFRLDASTLSGMAASDMVMPLRWAKAAVVARWVRSEALLILS